MKTKFIRLTTKDDLILQGFIYSPEQETKKAYLHIHGMGGNFYENRFLDFMAEGITNAGYTFMAINTRGHDMIADFPLAGSEEKYKRIGVAYEKFEECVLDIKSAIDYLEKERYSEIVLCGHSLGTSKVGYYVATTQDKRVQKLVLMSPSDMVGLAEAEKYHAGLLAEAKQMVAEGKGSDLLSTKIWDWYFLSAETYVDLSSRDYPVDVFNTYDKAKPSALEKITIPTLAFFGENDDSAILGSKEESLEVIKSKAPNAPRFDLDVIPGASHGYFGKEKEMTAVIVNWLNK